MFPTLFTSALVATLVFAVCFLQSTKLYQHYLSRLASGIVRYPLPTVWRTFDFYTLCIYLLCIVLHYQGLLWLITTEQTQLGLVSAILL
jgi:hypothetical protein